MKTKYITHAVDFWKYYFGDFNIEQWAVSQAKKLHIDTTHENKLLCGKLFQCLEFRFFF